MNHYMEIINQLDALIKSKKYKEAYKILSKELSMPYIPMEYEKQFIACKKELSLKMKDANDKKNIKSNFDKATIFQIILDKNLTLIPLALNQLKELNLKSSIGEIKKLFSNKTIPNSIKVIILEFIVDQDINIDMVVNTPFDSKIIQTNHSLSLNPNYKLLIKKLENNLNKEPSILNVAYSYVNHFIINLFPNNYIYEENDEFIFQNHAKKALGTKDITNKINNKKSQFIDKILKRYI